MSPWIHTLVSSSNYMVANLLKKASRIRVFWVQFQLSPPGGSSATVLSDNWFRAVETIINHLFPVTRRMKKSSCRSKWTCSVPDGLSSSTFFLSEIQLLQSFDACCGCSLCPSGQTCRVQWFCPCGPLCWCQSLVLEVIFQRLGQREALDLLKPVSTQRQAGRSPTQVH